MYTSLSKCRICGNSDLEPVLDLGIQALTGIFPRDKDEQVTEGPLQLVKCMGQDACGLLQLAHSYQLDEMYGDNYGYRSGLNASMVTHLKEKVARILTTVRLAPGDLVVDIGSNDSTTLQAYPSQTTLVGIDPTGTKFLKHYPPHIQLIPDFFSARLVRERFHGRKARVVTSFSMFYDLPDPLGFMRDIHEILADDGIWVFEQSYMPAMLATNSYDTACHEHLEYYGLSQIKWMTDRVGFEIVDVEFNDINGGSFSVTVQKSTAPSVRPSVQKVLDDELSLGLDGLEPYLAFAKRTDAQRTELRQLILSLRQKGKTVAVLGASTKGNVLLQYCELGADLVGPVAEVNPEKFGRVTPGTHIPIAPESEVLESHPDYLLVLPWHFRAFFLASPDFSGCRLIFPLPVVEIVQPGPTA